MVTEATGGHHLVDQHGLHCAWWTGAKNSMIWIQQRQKKTNKCKSQLQFFRCFMPSHGGFTLWLIFSGGLSLSSSYSFAGLIVDSQVLQCWPTHFISAWLTRQARERERGGHRPTTGTPGVEVHHPEVDRGGSYHPLITCMPSWIML